MRGRGRAGRPRSRTWVVLATVVLVLCAVSSCSSSPPAVAPTAQPAPPVTSSEEFVLGLGVPWTVGLANDTGGHDVGEWPPFPVSALRLWDSRTTWRDLQPAPRTWRFGALDAALAAAAAHGTSDVTLVLAGTPQWASVRTTAEDAPWIGPGSASPPRDLVAWQEYVTAVAERYRGRITSYEIGNEPNLRTFWNGTPGEWAAYVAVAASAIHAADPDATVVASVGLVRRARDLRSIAVWAATAAVSPHVDVLAIHAYPTRGTLAAMPGLLVRARSVLDAAGAQGRPAWVTEVNVSDGSSLPDAGQRAVVRRLTRSIADAGYARGYWYAWTALGPADLIQLSPGAPAAGTLQRLAAGGQPARTGPDLG